MIINQADAGMDNIDWNLTTKLATKSRVKYVVNAYFSLITIFIKMRLRRGFSNLVQKIKSHKISNNTELEDINILVAALNKACFYFPVRVKCLEWSFALYFLAKKYGINCQFVVGLQNYPFKSHSWMPGEREC